jgi:hypothetical protein
MIRRLYGAGPMHLALALASFTVAGWALARVLGTLGDPTRFVVWFAGAIVAHDLVLLPLYSAVGVVAGRLLARPVLNHVRVPLILSGLTLLVWFPLILRKSPAGYMRASGLSVDVFLGRWLALSAALVIASALAFALQTRRLRQ